MILCLDIGNTNIFGGIYQQQHLICQFRYPSTGSHTANDVGQFILNELAKSNVDIQRINQIAICSVVPSLHALINDVCQDYFSLTPFFLGKTAAIASGLDYRLPYEVGADRLSNAIAALEAFPNTHIIIVDLGTATTFDALTADALYLGGPILPGMHTAMTALTQQTAKLPPVSLTKPAHIIGEDTGQNIQAGLFYGQVGAIREITHHLKTYAFQDHPCTVIGTGGFSGLLREEGLFTQIMPTLVLEGLRLTASKIPQ